MDDHSEPTCRLIRPDDTYDGKQGLTYFNGIAAETTGSKGICMHLLTIPPGGRAKAHMHESHETAIYVLDGEAVALYGDKLQHQTVTKAGDLFQATNAPGVNEHWKCIRVVGGVADCVALTRGPPSTLALAAQADNERRAAEAVAKAAEKATEKARIKAVDDAARAVRVSGAVPIVPVVVSVVS